jgi:hypothetical protein
MDRVCWSFYGSIALYFLLVFIDSTIQNRNFIVGFLSIFSSLILLLAYGLGVMRSILVRIIFKKGDNSKRYKILKE